MSNSTKLAHSLLRQLIEVGVSDFVISPGSRNAPLSIALGEAASKEIIDLHVKIDERGAAYYALGISKASNNYVAVICTSGTAAANFHPAALEAFHSNNKLILITADRPARLRRTGANQTTDQVNIYPVIKTHDFAAEIDIKKLLTGGMVHLNVQFDEPLIESEKTDWLAGLKILLHTIENRVSGKLEVGSGVLIIGHDRAGYSVAEVNDFVGKLNWPVICEDPISFPQSIAHASLFLTDPQIAAKLSPENVIVIGRTTLSRSTNTFIKLAKKVIVIDPRTADVDNKREADLILKALPNEIVSIKSDQIIWREASGAAAIQLENLPWSEQLAITIICELLPEESALFVGSSRPVRDIEAFAHPRNGVSVFANRGLAGIDGNISTVFGITNEFEKTTAILGDLTFLHDISALTNATVGNLRIFVIDNNGGGIFSTLPQASTGNFEQLFGTPHNLDLCKVIAGFGVAVGNATNLMELQSAASKEIKGFEVVVVTVPSRESNAEQLKSVTQRVSSAVRIGINLA
ncbi:MAG: 2-succinyl-5-enolpyruvyl-6-hydroxy-3-cyclohexene-1-carboxylic-acid synthase [Actinobacteria bacterium]|nr:2-succinyl-5-enolpyruvyl-6-hydroxy-3-cyclohexene-1-carboxylic-acid synthase [Actinomycetota bacterium]